MSCGLLLLLCGVLVVSCKSKTSSLTYKMKNIATDSVIVIRSMTDMPLQSDTSWVGYNQEVAIAVTEEGSEHVSTYKQAGTLTRFATLTVYKIHFAQRARTDFTNATLWSYDEKDKHRADYTTVISDSDF